MKLIQEREQLQYQEPLQAILVNNIYINFRYLRFYFPLFFAILFFSSLSNAQRKKEMLQKEINFPTPVVSITTYNNSKKIASDIFLDASKISGYFGTLENGLEYYLKALAWAKENGTDSQIIATKNSVLQFYTFLHIDTKIIEMCRDLLQYTEIQESKMGLSILYTLKEAYRQSGQFDDLIEILPKYHQYSKKYGYLIKGEESEATDIAYAHYSLKNYQKAIESYKESAQEKELHGAYFQKSSMLNNIGLCFYHAKKNDSATYYFDKALWLIQNKVTTPEKRNGYTEHFINVIKSNKAEISLSKGNLDKSLPYFKKELLSGIFFNELNIIASSYYNIGKIAYLKNQPKIAIQYIDSALVILKKRHNAKRKKLALLLKAKSYLHLKEYKKANKFFNIHKNYSDSLDAEKARKNYMVDMVIHEIDQKEKELLVTKEQFKLIEKENFYQQLGLGLFALIGIGLFFTYSRMKKGRVIIASQKREVDMALVEKGILLKEIRHRIKNNLQVVSSLLHVHSGKINNKEFEELLDQSQRQIYSMSLVHEILYQKNNIAVVSMQDYLNELCEHLLSTFSNISVCSTINANNISLSVDLVNPIGLIVSELVTNSSKHAFKGGEGAITIELSKKEDFFIFMFKDNGKGINPKNTTPSDAQLGKKLIVLLAEEINAELQEYNDNGLTYVFKFKDKIKK